MSDLGLAGSGAVVNPSVHHQSAADTAPEGDVEDRIGSPAGPVQGFAEGGRNRGMFRITVDRPGGKTGALGQLGIATTGGLKPVALSLDGRPR